MNPVGRVYYSFSTMLCVPNALSQPGGYTLGAQAGETAIRQVVTEAGFTRFRRAAQTPRSEDPSSGCGANESTSPHRTILRYVFTDLPVDHNLHTYRRIFCAGTHGLGCSP